MNRHTAVLLLEQQILDCHSENTRLRDAIEDCFNSQNYLDIGSDEYNAYSSKIHSLFRVIEDNHLKIARFYRRLDKIEGKQNAY